MKLEAPLIILTITFHYSILALVLMIVNALLMFLLVFITHCVLTETLWNLESALRRMGHPLYTHSQILSSKHNGERKTKLFFQSNVTHTDRTMFH